MYHIAFCSIPPEAENYTFVQANSATYVYSHASRIIMLVTSIHYTHTDFHHHVIRGRVSMLSWCNIDYYTYNVRLSTPLSEPAVANYNSVQCCWPTCLVSCDRTGEKLSAPTDYKNDVLCDLCKVKKDRVIIMFLLWIIQGPFEASSRWIRI